MTRSAVDPAAPPAACIRHVPGPDVGPPIVTRARVEHLMGMPISVYLRGAESDIERAGRAVDRVYAHLRRVDRVFSTYRPDSDLMRLRDGRARPDEVHPWIAEVVDLCLAAAERTDGLFSAWLGGAPGDPAVFDPTGLVKGWGVESAARYLAAMPGITYGINAGGDVVLGVGVGLPAQPPVWRIGIEDPRDPSRIAAVVERSRGGVATSGARARGAHVVDPRSGLGVDRAGSDTVDGPTLLWADVWATAAFVDPAQVARLLPERDPEYRLTHL